ncbi:FAD-dependent thymidylate synthase [Massilia sp. TN1-12]|uniref:FAD-dependent thymidylate synthase n=1 Tax=Massilia paldalensis TaxID=3377675 RepID=UPI00384E5F73
MTITAKVVEHSIAPHGKKLATYQLRYPRFIHAELMTHRVFSRNASSSRAIPVAKMIAEVRSAPAMPIHWGKNQPGMQAHQQLTGDELFRAKARWMLAAEVAANQAEAMAEIGVHKQVVNRILEPFLHISVIVTATEFDNWNELRAHPDAQPEIHELALQMQAAISASTPVFRPMDRLHERAWHLPYVTVAERQQYADQPLFLAKLSAARCARVSYLTHDGREPLIREDLKLFDLLVGARPLHASPVEHQAYPMPLATQQSKNFFGWRQHRELVEFDIYHPQPQS